MLRNAKRIEVTDFFGLQSFASSTNIAPNWFIDSKNVVITNDGSAGVLRSADTFNNPIIGVPGPILSIFDYDKSTGHLILFGIMNGDGIVETIYVTTSTGSNAALFGATSLGKTKMLTINDRCYVLSGDATIFQTTNGVPGGTFQNGIRPPAFTPTLSYVAGGTGDFLDGINLAYAYRNTTTTHVSAPSPVSAQLGATTANHTLRIAVQPGIEFGVDGIVVYMTTDGGAIRYLLTDSSGNARVFPNISPIQLSIADIYWDTLTPETVYNVPLTGGDGTFPHYMFKWRNRLCLCDFREPTTRQNIQYSAFESVYYGVPWESWPPENTITLPNKGDSARSGAETPVGALVLGESDSYLIRGTLTDKVGSPESVISATESIQPLSWSIGTRSPHTLVITPFGAIWFDQSKRIQLWNYDDFPEEAGLPLRAALAAIQDSDTARNMAEAIWFQHGTDGGIYVLTASTAGTTNNKQFIITVYRNPENNQLRFASAVSDYSAQSIGVCEIDGRARVLAGIGGQLHELYNLDQQGDGWTAEERYFTVVLGNDSEFMYWHSLRFDATDVTGLSVTISNLDGTDAQDVKVADEFGGGSSWFGMLHSYGFRKLLTFSFDKSDDTKRVINNLFVKASVKARSI